MNQIRFFTLLLQLVSRYNITICFVSVIIELFCLGHGKIVDELLKNEADINVQNIHGETPLHQAVKNGLTIYIIKIEKKSLKLFVYSIRSRRCC